MCIAKNDGEEIAFGFGGIGLGKRRHDTAKRALEKPRLTNHWQTIWIKLDHIRWA